MRFQFLIVVVLAMSTGCESEPPFVDNSVDPGAFALDVKEVILNHSSIARTSAEPADSVSVIEESVSNLDGSPTGDHRSTFEKILSTSKGLLKECQSSARNPPSLHAKLDELVKLAQTLPGDVKAGSRQKKE